MRIYIRQLTEVVCTGQHVVHLVVVEAKTTGLTIFAAKDRRHHHKPGVAIRPAHVPVIAIQSKSSMQEEHGRMFLALVRRGLEPRFETQLAGNILDLGYSSRRIYVSLFLRRWTLPQQPGPEPASRLGVVLVLDFH